MNHVLLCSDLFQALKGKLLTVLGSQRQKDFNFCARSTPLRGEGNKEAAADDDDEDGLVNWCFEPSQSLGIIPGRRRSGNTAR